MATAKKNTIKKAPAKKSSTATRSFRTTAKVPQKTESVKESAKTFSTSRVSVINTDMLRRPQVFVPVLVVLIALLLYFGRGWFLVALVNGHPISRVTLDRELEARYGKTVVDSLVTQQLIQQEAAQKHVTVSNEELQQAMKQISDAVSAQGQSLDQVLAARNMTRKDFEDQVRLQKLVEKMLGDKVKVSDKEIQDYIDQNKDNLPQGMSDAQLKAEVKQQLEQQKLSEQAQTWIQDLQKKAKIQYLINL